jgi:death-on-curing protein
MEPTFLTLQEVLDLQEHQIAQYGGSLGVRDLGLLESALAMPQAQFGGAFLHEDLFMMAAAYLFHIVKNHPFVDGNKRAGLATTILFLNLNGRKLVADKDELTDLVLAVAQSQAGKEQIADFLRRNTAG